MSQLVSLLFSIDAAIVFRYAFSDRVLDASFFHRRHLMDRVLSFRSHSLEGQGLRSYLASSCRAGTSPKTFSWSWNIAVLRSINFLPSSSAMTFPLSTALFINNPKIFRTPNVKDVAAIEPVDWGFLAAEYEIPSRM